MELLWGEHREVEQRGFLSCLLSVAMLNYSWDFGMNMQDGQDEGEMLEGCIANDRAGVLWPVPLRMAGVV